MSGAASRAITVRLDAELAEWLDREAKGRAGGRRAVLEEALRLQADERPAVPAPPPERVPSPAQTGTEHWRDPTPEEVEDTRLRFEREFPDREPLPPERFARLCRAEARARDQGRLAFPGEVIGRGPSRPVVADADKVEPEGEPSSFERLTMARVDLFSHLRTPGSVKGEKPRERS